MIKKILFFLYINSFFRCCVYILRIGTLYDKKFREQISFYRYFKKKKHYKKDILKIIHQPKIFIINFSYDTKKIIKKIYDYDILYQDNEYSNDGHKKIYQSPHDLNQDKKFKNISVVLENFINNKITKFFSYKRLKLIRMWFVITKNFGIMKKHSHFNSDLSAVFYLRVDKNIDYKSGLKIHNVMKNIEIYNYSNKKKSFKKTINKNKSFIIKPKKNDIIILNSYIEHSVVNTNSKIVDRISLPFDLVF